MDNLTFGVTIIVVGAVGSTACLLLLSFVISILKKLFPYKNDEEKEPCSCETKV
ncbi:MAG: hypothetical protein GX846_08880 [Deltaproteobacteria bacterium]|nr:hypothetical protein [Deltaproteobacteria bacterium]